MLEKSRPAESIVDGEKVKHMGHREHQTGIGGGYLSGATISNMRRDARESERDGEELPRLSPGVGCDSTAQGNKVR